MAAKCSSSRTASLKTSFPSSSRMSLKCIRQISVKPKFSAHFRAWGLVNRDATNLYPSALKKSRLRLESIIHEEIKINIFKVFAEKTSNSITLDKLTCTFQWWYPTGGTWRRSRLRRTAQSHPLQNARKGWLPSPEFPSDGTWRCWRDSPSGPKKRSSLGLSGRCSGSQQS